MSPESPTLKGMWTKFASKERLAEETVEEHRWEAYYQAISGMQEVMYYRKWHRYMDHLASTWGVQNFDKNTRTILQDGL